MVKLTEEMIVARTRVSDMANVKKLNCWGAELTDISVLRKLINVEVLSLSVNCISTLADIQNCKNLQELYIRKNKIPDLSEICWLRELTKLKSLWLEENPCVQDHGELYRVTVIRTLPQLQKLDNIAVQPDEMADAMRRGMELIHPLEREPVSYHSMSSYQPQSLAQRTRGPEDSFEAAAEAGDRCFSPSRDDKTGGNRRQSLDPSYPPSRRVSNQAFDATTAVGEYRTSPGRQMSSYGSRRSSSVHPPAYDEGGAGGYVPEYHTGRRYSQQEMGNVRRSPRMSQASLDDGVRRMSVHESAYDDERNANYAMSDPRGNPYQPQQQPPPPPGANYSTAASYGYPAGAYYEYNQRALPTQSVENGHQDEAPVESSSSPTNSTTTVANGGGGNETAPRGVASSQPRSLVHSSNASDATTSSNSTHSQLTRSASTNIATNGEQQQGDAGRQSLRQQHGVRRTVTNSVDGESDAARAVVAQHYEQTYEQVNQQIDSAQQLIARRKSYSPEGPRRPKNRNSNILSAVLCLIKELDGPSLEVAEMAVRCRMEELDD